MEGGRSWEELSTDCLVFIFSKLGLEDLSVGVPLVCKSWHRASLEPECWKILNFQDIDFSANSKFIARYKQEYSAPPNFCFAYFLKLSIARSRGCAIRLSLPSMPNSPLLPDLISASIECPKLKVLSLPVLLHQDNMQISGLIGRWKELEKLEMKWKPVSFLKIVEEIRANCPKFDGLGLCGIFDDRDANAIAKRLPGLKSLAMRESFLHRDDLVTILTGCRKLQEVDVSRCWGFDADDEMVKMASAGIKEFVAGDCKVEGNDLNNFPVFRYDFKRL